MPVEAERVETEGMEAARVVMAMAAEDQEAQPEMEVQVPVVPEMVAVVVVVIFLDAMPVAVVLLGELTEAMEQQVRVFREVCDL